MLLLTSCDYVSYKEVSTQDSNIELATTKQSYIDLLYSMSDYSAYEDDKRRLYLDYLLDAKYSIENCESIDQAEELYKEYKKKIESIRTIYSDEYLLEKAKELYTKKVTEYISTNLYREAEAEEIIQLLEATILAINDATSVEDIELLYRGYEINI